MVSEWMNKWTNKQTDKISESQGISVAVEGTLDLELRSLSSVSCLATCAVLCLVAQWCPTLCEPMNCSTPDSSVHGDSPGKNTGVGCYVLLQRIFPTQRLNPGFLHCRWILYHLSHQGSPSTYYIQMWIVDLNSYNCCK